MEGSTYVQIAFLFILYIASRNQTTSIIALHFPGLSSKGEKMERKKMHHNQQQRELRSLCANQESIVIQVFGDANTTTHGSSLIYQTLNQQQQKYTTLPPSSSSSFSIKFNFSAMKLFHRFRKILMRLVFSSVPSSSPPSHAAGRSTDSRNNKNNCDRFDPPKTSCSSYYSSYSHYNEAIADCIEFFNKSAEDGILDGRKSDVV